MARSLAFICVLGFLSAGVSVSAAGARSPRGGASQHRGGWMAPDANPKHAWLYVADGQVAVTIYDLDRIGNPQIGSITQGLSTPGGVGIDGNGNVYVANETGGNVTVYAPGATSPSSTLVAPGAPEAVAFDSDDDVWVAVRGTNPGIAEYLPGETTPAQYITSNLVQIPSELAFDATGTLYIADDYMGVSILPPGRSQVVTSLDLSGLLPDVTSGLAIDPRTGNFYVSFAKVPPTEILEYEPGQQAPARTRKATFGGTNFLAAGLLKRKVVIFAPDCARDLVYLLEPALHGTIGAISTAAPACGGVAFKPAGIP
jgi:hypothetical protein